MPPDTTPWLAGYRRTAGARLRLFCFPPAGGAASGYQPWERQLPAGVELCRVQLPGREGRFAEPPVTTLQALLPQLLTALTPYFDVPFAFFGHSMGSLVAFELMRRMRSAGLPLPRALFPSGHRAPHLPLRRRLWADLPKDDLVQELREIDGIPAELDNDELLDLVLPTVRVDLRLYEAYAHQPGDAFDCPVVVYGGDRDQLVRVDELEEWRQHTRGTCTVRVLPGRHFFLHQQRDEMLRCLRADLDAVLGRLG